MQVGWFSKGVLLQENLEEIEKLYESLEQSNDIAENSENTEENIEMEE